MDSPKINYQAILNQELKKIKALDKLPMLMLHSCCAPCSSYVLEYLSEYFEIVIAFYNPNISPVEEYNYRLNEVKRLISEMPLKNKVSIIDVNYEPEKFDEIALGLEDSPERGSRCQKCIRLRLEKTLSIAKSFSADYFTTTLTISPHKDSAFINSVGKELENKSDIKYLFSDFKKREGYKRSIQLSNEYNLYRQAFCGCTYSKTLLLNK